MKKKRQTKATGRPKTAARAQIKQQKPKGGKEGRKQLHCEPKTKPKQKQLYCLQHQADTDTDIDADTHQLLQSLSFSNAKKKGGGRGLNPLIDERKCAVHQTCRQKQCQAWLLALQPMTAVLQSPVSRREDALLCKAHAWGVCVRACVHVCVCVLRKHTPTHSLVRPMLLLFLTRTAARQGMGEPSKQ